MPVRSSQQRTPRRPSHGMRLAVGWFGAIVLSPMIATAGELTAAMHSPAFTELPTHTPIVITTNSFSEPTTTAAHPGNRVVVQEYGHHRRSQELNVSVGSGLTNSGVAVWWALPLVHDGFVPQINDAFYLELGTIFGLYRGQFYWEPGPAFWVMSFSGGGRWDLFLTEAWNIFLTLKLAVNVGFDAYDLGWLWPGVGVGGQWRMNDNLQMRLELGFPLGLAGGLTFDFPSF